LPTVVPGTVHRENMPAAGFQKETCHQKSKLVPSQPERWSSTIRACLTDQ